MSTDDETALERLEDVRELDPTSNGELRDRWGMDSTREVAQYLREELAEHTYRDDDSRIRAQTDETGGGEPDDQEPPTEDPRDVGDDEADEETGAGGPDDQDPPIGGPGGVDEETDRGSAGADTEPADVDQSVSVENEPTATAYAPETDASSGEAQTSTVNFETVDTAPARGAAEHRCPGCGGELTDFSNGKLFLATDGVVAAPEKGDRICESCDLLVANSGKVIWGSESAAATPAPDCRKCGDKTFHNAHALYMLARWYKQTGQMKDADRRRVKKLEQNIKQNADYACVNCWAMYST